MMSQKLGRWIALASLILAPAAGAQSLYGPDQGDWELTLGGGGSNDKDFDTGGASLNASVGYFLTENFEVGVRQTVGFEDRGEYSWRGSTYGFVDYHFNLDRWRPFVGASFGGNYSRGDDTFGAGLEGGVKYYVYEKTFIFGMAEYQFLFNELGQADNQIDDGNFVYTVGVGFNF